MIRQNLGKLDRVLRFVLAFWWIGPMAPHYASDLANWGIFLVGWIALIESFTAWCWLHTAFHLDNKNQ